MKSNGRKKILIITDVFKMMAGSERNITHLLNNLDPVHFEPIVASFVLGKLGQEMREKDFTMLELSQAGLYTIAGIRNLFSLYQLVRSENISLIVTYHESSDFYGLVLSRLCHVPIISSTRDMGFATGLHHKMAYKLSGKLFSGVIAVSDAVREEVVRRNWFRRDRIFTIYNGVDTEKYNRGGNSKEIRESIGIKRMQPVVGLIANLRKIKGVRYFIEAASIISKTNPEVQFLIIGGDVGEPGSTKSDMELFAKQCGADKIVQFLGKRTDIPDLISLIDVGVVASLSEGFSNTILEYMAASKPVVATDVGGNREAVIHEGTGLLVPPKSADALAKAILSIIENKEIASQYGTAGRRRVEEKFELKRMIKQYEGLFEIVMSGKLR
jgi:glycosyltransferase involved in cell wall biosynthesis